MADIVLVDVSPLSLGIEIEGGLMSVIVPRNSSIPFKKDKEYVTTADNQTSCRIQVYEGERKLTKDNMKLGEFRLENLPMKKAGEAKITVYFQVDSNGLLNLTAEDK